MTTPRHTAVSRRDPVAALRFYTVFALLSPATLAGYALWVARLYAARRSGVSATAQGPLTARWLQHHLGTRPDEPAARLLVALPGISPVAIALVFGPLLLAHRLSDYVPRTFRYPFAGAVSLQNQAAARQTFYDAVVDRYLPPLTQFVILGAGFDIRALRLRHETPVRSFEVDTPSTQVIKRAALQRAGVNAASVTFVAANFEQGDWFSQLVEAGFDADEPALFLWEGVTPYLSRAAVEDTLRAISRTAPSSVVAFDYLTTALLESQSLYLRLLRASLRAGGEPLTFGIDSAPPLRERVAEWLRARGLSLAEQHTLGQEVGWKRAWGGFAVAVVN